MQIDFSLGLYGGFSCKNETFYREYFYINLYKIAKKYDFKLIEDHGPHPGITPGTVLFLYEL